MEAFSRPLWALGPFWAGGGRDAALEAIYRNGFAHGADPKAADYWGTLGDCDQCFVEMAAFACAMIEVPPSSGTLSLKRQGRTLRPGCVRSMPASFPTANWLFFRMLVNLALDAVGAGGDAQLVEQDLAEIESWYVGDGWYSDGNPGVKPQRDYYIPWAIQYYGVLYSVYAAKRDPGRAARFRDRALAFGRQFAAWFDTNGGVNLYAPAEVEKNDHGQFAEKYGKFCYSTRFGFSASRSYAQLAQAAPDSMLAFEIGGQIFVRRHSLRFEVRPDSLFSVWSPFPGITVETEIRPTPTGHIRRHKIHSEIACTAWDCGFAVPRYAPGYTAAAEDGAATAANAAVGCTVRGDGKAEVFNTWANTNLYDPNCAIPARRYAIHAGDSEWHCEIVEE